MLSERYTREQDRYRRREPDARIPGAAPRGRAEYGLNRPNWGNARSDYGQNAYGGRLDNRGFDRGERRDERGFLERTSDEVRSWFGDDEAEKRRRIDEREDARRYRAGDGRWQRGYSSRGQNWPDIQARDVMTTDVECVDPNDSVEHAARLMRDCDCGAIPVVDRDRRLMGMITDRDIAVRLVARGADIRKSLVYDCMTDEAFACEETSSIDDCMRDMSRHQVRRLPIVDRRGRVVGIVSQSDLARHAEEHRGTGERRAVADVLCAVSEPSAQPYR